MLPPPTLAADERATFLRERVQEFNASINALGSAAGLANGQAFVLDNSTAQMLEQRREALQELMAMAPNQALEAALKLEDIARLPGAVKREAEEHFSVIAELVVIPPEGNSPGESWLVMPDSSRLDVKLHGRRAGIISKNALPVQGIRLGKQAAIWDTPVRRVEERELPALRAAIAPRTVRPGRALTTGQPMRTAGPRGLMGGYLAEFESEDDLQAFNAALIEMEMAPGPDTGLDAWLASDQGDLASLQTSAVTLSTGWTLTSKEVFFIRVAFPNLPGEPISRDALIADLNGPTSDAISDFSYGKTWIEAAVSQQVVQLPQNSSFYAQNDCENYSTLYNDARTAFNGLGTGVNLNGYDIVGVYFPDIGCSWGGRASIGGSSHWIQQPNGTHTLVHEFGHNYGLSHASRWLPDTPAAGNPVGPGTNIEYGDPFDRMGTGQLPQAHFHLEGKVRLNWIADNQWVDGGAPGGFGKNYRIYRFDHASPATGKLLGLRLDKCNSDDYYWLGYRQNFPGEESLHHGVVVNWEKALAQKSWLLDISIGALHSSEGVGLRLGQTYSDPGGCLHITPLSQGGIYPEEWIELRVHGGAPGNQPPENTQVSGNLVAQARVLQRYRAQTLDPEGDDIAFLWEMNGKAVPSSDSSVTYLWGAGGDYQVKVFTSDMKGGIDSAETSVHVADPLQGSWEAFNPGSTPVQWTIGATRQGEIMFFTPAGGGAVALSSDTQQWTLAPIGGNSPNRKFRGLVYNGQRWIAVGEDFDFGLGQWVGVIYTSENGTQWVERRRGGAALDFIACGLPGCIAVSDFDNALLFSADGMLWTDIDMPDNYSLRGTAWGNGKFLVAGFDITEGSYFSLSSEDGSTWSNPNPVAYSINDVQFLNGLFFFDGVIEMHVSPDGLNFTTVERMISVPTLSFGNGIFIGIEYDFDTSEFRRVISTDGLSWYSLTLDRHSQAHFFNNQFLVLDSESGVLRSPLINDDPDWDGLASQAELSTHLTNPNLADSDGDGLFDGEEVNTFGTQPNLNDSDGDVLGDADEVLLYGTDPILPDSDDDTLPDGEEVELGLDPLDSICPDYRCNISPTRAWRSSLFIQ